MDDERQVDDLPRAESDRTVFDDDNLGPDDSPGIVGTFIHQVGSSLTGLLDQAEAALEGEEGLAGTLKRNPLAAVGIAFSAGFLVAVTTGGTPRSQFLDNRRRQIRAVLLGGLTAAALQEARSVLQEEEVAEMLKHWRDAGRKRLAERDLF